MGVEKKVVISLCHALFLCTSSLLFPLPALSPPPSSLPCKILYEQSYTVEWGLCRVEPSVVLDIGIFLCLPERTEKVTLNRTNGRLRLFFRLIQ